MASALPSKPDFWRRYGTTLFGGALALIAVSVVAGALWHKPADSALVIATSGDCLRVFDAGICQQIVDASLEIHARTAPRYLDETLCALSYGADGCRAIAGRAGAPAAFVPQIAVILSTRAKADGPQVLLPLYFGPPRAHETLATGRRVFYRGIAVGEFSQNKFGGAQLSRVNDLSGHPLSSADVRRLRRG